MARVKRSRSEPLAGRPGSTVSVTVEVWAAVTDGTVTQDDLALFVEHAVAHYHRFRAGNVGSCEVVGGVAAPGARRLYPNVY